MPSSPCCGRLGHAHVAVMKMGKFKGKGKGKRKGWQGRGHGKGQHKGNYDDGSACPW